MAVILRRRGMAAARPRPRRPRVPVHITAPFPECTAPNDVWCMDFKGWFRTHDGITEDHGRPYVCTGY